MILSWILKCRKSIPRTFCHCFSAQSYWGISHWLGSGLGSDSKTSLSRATSVNILQLGSEIPSLHWKSELNLVHSSPFSIYWLMLDHPPLNTIGKGKVMLVYWERTSEGSAQARLRLSSGFSELSPEPSQCEMPRNACRIWTLSSRNPADNYVHTRGQTNKTHSDNFMSFYWVDWLEYKLIEL